MKLVARILTTAVHRLVVGAVAAIGSIVTDRAKMKRTVAGESFLFLYRVLLNFNSCLLFTLTLFP